MIAVHLEDGNVTVRQQAAPRQPRGFALIRLLCAGICNTDLELQRGYYGFHGVPGHEFVGEVVRAGDPGLVEKRVVGEINLNCGHCDWCRRGLSRHCPRRKVLGIVGQPGVFQEFFVLPEHNLHVLPDSISNEEAVFTEPLAAACEILDQVEIPQDTAVAVLGDGKLGLLISQVLRVHGAEVHLFGRHPQKLQIAEAAGAQANFTSKRMPKAAYDCVVDATGSPEGLRLAVEMTRPRGTVILKSTVHGTVPIDAAPVIVNEITLVGSRCGRFEPALRLLQNKDIHVRDLISARLRLAEAPRAFELAARKSMLKVLLIA
jgi:alcohol dehydrogenase